MIDQRYVSAALCVISVATSQPAAAQSPDLGPLRAAQAELERQRLDDLPVTRPIYRSCDVQIGRYCYWLPQNDVRRPRPEGARFMQARIDLLERLHRARPAHDSSAWLVGQIVRYETERDSTLRAVQSTQGCAPSIRWWCLALRGYALHRAHQFDAAEHTFGEALAAMPEDMRCRWTDLSPLLSGSAGRRYRRMDCESRDAYQDTLLWLADPLFTTPGNELWTDHLSRHVWSGILQDSRTPSGDPWDRSMHRGIIRYGLPTWWSRERADSRSGGRPRVITHHETDSHFYLPVSTFTALGQISPDLWDLDHERPPSWHSAGNGMGFSNELVYETARFPRLGGQVVAVAVDVTADPDLGAGPHTLSVFTGIGPGTALGRADTTLGDGAGAVVVRSDHPDAMLSVEVVNHTRTEARRVRRGIAGATSATGPVRVSDLLVLAPGPELPTSLPEAIQRFHAVPTFTAGMGVDLYWELLVSHRELFTMQASVRLQRTGRSFLRRFLEATPLASPNRPVSLEWMEPVSTDHGLYPWALTVTLPSNIDAGVYRLTLELEAADGNSWVRERNITVRH